MWACWLSKRLVLSDFDCQDLAMDCSESAHIRDGFGGLALEWRAGQDCVRQYLCGRKARILETCRADEGRYLENSTVLVSASSGWCDGKVARVEMDEGIGTAFAFATGVPSG